MDLPDEALASFAVFAEHLNFTRAAAHLRISQPSLHVKVRKLAEGLGRPLYRRDGRQLALTPDGLAVARFAREQEERRAAFLAELRGGRPDRPVILAAGEGAYLYLLGGVVQAARAEGRLRLVNADRARMLTAVRAGRAHLGVGVLDVPPDELEIVHLASYPQVLVMPRGHALARRRSVALRQLEGAELIVAPPGRPHRVALETALRAEGVRWSIGVEAEGWPLMLHFVGLGTGLAVVNGCVDLPPHLTGRPIRDLPTVPYHAVHRPGAREDPRVASLLDRIVAQVPRG
jgi:DNA-binding transcriptional LysR family regulator